MSRGGRDYSSKDYWDDRYLSEEKGHVWYFSYETLQPLLHAIVPAPCDDNGWSVLEIGCGDRPLLPDLIQDEHFAGKTHAVAIDYAPTLVRQLRRDERERLMDAGETSGVTYAQADARSLDYSSGSFDLVRPLDCLWAVAAPLVS